MKAPARMGGHEGVLLSRGNLRNVVILLAGIRVLEYDGILARPPTPGLHSPRAVFAGLTVLLFLAALTIPRKGRSVRAGGSPARSTDFAPVTDASRVPPSPGSQNL